MLYNQNYSKDSKVLQFNSMARCDRIRASATANGITKMIGFIFSPEFCQFFCFTLYIESENDKILK